MKSSSDTDTLLQGIGAATVDVHTSGEAREGSGSTLIKTYGTRKNLSGDNGRTDTIKLSSVGAEQLSLLKLSVYFKSSETGASPQGFGAVTVGVDTEDEAGQNGFWSGQSGGSASKNLSGDDGSADSKN